LHPSADFAAPWGPRLRALTGLGTGVLLGEGVLMLVLSRCVPHFETLFAALGAGLFALLGAMYLGEIRGYRIEAGRLVVQRPLWTTQFALEGLRRAVRDSNALRFTAWGFGNGGLFAISDRRWVEPYGWCRSLATDPDKAVVLCWDDRRLIVTPDRPDEFVARLTPSR
jgi:hypothetical protein